MVERVRARSRSSTNRLRPDCRRPGFDRPNSQLARRESAKLGAPPSRPRVAAMPASRSGLRTGRQRAPISRGLAATSRARSTRRGVVEGRSQPVRIARAERPAGVCGVGSIRGAARPECEQHVPAPRAQAVRAGDRPTLTGPQTDRGAALAEYQWVCRSRWRRLRTLDHIGDAAVIGRQRAHRVGVRGVAGQHVSLAAAAAKILGALGAGTAGLAHPALATVRVERG